MRGYFSLEIDLPTLEVFGVREIIKMQVRAPISRIFHRTILIISSSSAIKRIPGSMTPGKSRSWYCTILQFLSILLFVQQFCLYQLASIRKKLLPNSLGFGKNAEDGPYRAGRFSKTFPEVPNKFQVDLQASPDVPNDFRVLGCKQ